MNEARPAQTITEAQVQEHHHVLIVLMNAIALKWLQVIDNGAVQI
jgi:hypothetical protein